MKLFAVYKETYQDCENSTHTLVGLHSKEENAQRHAEIITFIDYKGNEISGWVKPIELDSINLDELQYKIKTREFEPESEPKPYWYEPEYLEGFD